MTAAAGGVERFELGFPQRELDDLRDRLARTRWLDEFPGSGWTYGTSRSYLEELCRYWRQDFDWRACEARLNAFGQVAIDVDGQRIHAVHAPSPEPGALSLLLVHGWPGSVFEFEKVIEPLRDPVRYGGSAGDAFHVVCPSIPGYGFSGPTAGPGWNVRRILAAFALLMERLGYQRYGAAGGDVPVVQRLRRGRGEPLHQGRVAGQRDHLLADQDDRIRGPAVRGTGRAEADLSAAPGTGPHRMRDLPARRAPGTRSWAERLYTITRWTDMPAGGHFPSLEEPELFVADLAEFFRSYR